VFVYSYQELCRHRSFRFWRPHAVEEVDVGAEVAFEVEVEAKAKAVAEAEAEVVAPSQSLGPPYIM